MLGKPIQLKSVDEGTTFTINDRQYVSMMVSPYYYIAVESVDGLFGADISYESHPLPNIPGEKSGDAFRRGKTITLTGKIYSRGLAELYAGAYYLQEMFQENTGLRKLCYTPWNYNVQIYHKVRVNQDLSISEQFTSTAYKWSWTVGLRADDPKSYTVSGDTLLPTWQE